MNQLFNKLNNIVGWLVFAIATTVYALTAEPTGSLWDCGEFISASHKLQVVHPPGAPLFLMINRMFAFVAETVSDNPENIAYAVNLSSGVCTAFLVLFIFWSTTILAKLSLVGKKGEIENWGEIIAILGAGTVAGLSTTFATSVWFSAVEGEVYAMSSFFTGLVVWATLRWFTNDSPKADRWLVFIAYMIGLSISVHLLSILVTPFVALLYYYKYKTNIDDRTFPWKGTIIAGLIGLVILGFIQGFIIPQIPAMAAGFDYLFVNTFGTGVGMGMLFFVILLAAGLAIAISWATKNKKYHTQTALVSLAMILVGFSTYGMIVIRANTAVPINMNNPNDPYSLLSYLNREQYGDRPLSSGPHYMAQTRGYKPVKDVYRPVTDAQGKVKYEVVDNKSEPIYDKADLMFLPRLGHLDKGNYYQDWLGHKNRPTQADNIKFLFKYQMNWMYWRYFMWNFSGRQNSTQGTNGNVVNGNWITGFDFIDSGMLYDQSNMTDAMRNDKGRNAYYMLPLIFGLLGMFFHFQTRPKEAFAVLGLFLITGIAIILYLNQPPIEPRERDYAVVGSFFTFCIWIGMSVPLLYATISKYLSGAPAAIAGTALAISAPIIMGAQNWDDHSRAGHYGARDYAVNFLQTCAPNAIIFTYGDNDTYPLWYAQEVEGIRRDVRVVNFSLLAVDWYINQLRFKVNESDAIKMTMPESAYRGAKRNYLPVEATNRPMNFADAVKFIATDNGKYAQQKLASYIPTNVFTVPVDKAAILKNHVIPSTYPDSLLPEQLEFRAVGNYWTKDDIALADIISTNIANGWERPIYFAVTCRVDKLEPYKNYLQLEGMGLRLVPYKTEVRDAYAAMQLGSIEVDTTYRNIMERFRWGNFDKMETFIDENYRPSVQSVQYVMLRLADELVRRNDFERAGNIIDKFFEAFPHFNFPYDENRVIPQILAYYYEIGQDEKGDKVAEVTIDALVEKQIFYNSLTNPRDIKSHEQDAQYNAYLLDFMRNIASKSKNEAKKAELLGKISSVLGQPKSNINLLN